MDINLTEHDTRKYQVWRKLNKISLTKIAKIIDIHYSTVSRWENRLTNLPDCVIGKYDSYIAEFEKKK